MIQQQYYAAVPVVTPPVDYTAADAAILEEYHNCSPCLSASLRRTRYMLLLSRMGSAMVRSLWLAFWLYGHTT